MTLTCEPARPSDHALLMILIDFVWRNGFEDLLSGQVCDWMDAAYQDHQDALNGLLDSRPLTDPVERQEM